MFILRNNQEIILFILCWMLLIQIVSAGTVYMPDMVYQDGYVRVQGDGETEITILGWGSNIVQFDQVKIGVVGLSSTMTFVVSHLNEQADNMSKNQRILEFNASYGGSNSITFTFIGNDSNDNMLYNLFVDGVLKRDEVGPYSFSYTQTSWSAHRFLLACGGYAPDPPYNGTSSFNATGPAVNLTWSRGNHSNQEVVVGKTSGYPASPSDGTVWQNSTSLYYNFSVNESQFFTVWSYNSSTNTFSAYPSLQIPWGAIGISVFNESQELPIGFNLEISNQAGSVVYQRDDLVNTHYIDYIDIPTGENVHFVVSNSSYRTRDRTENIQLNNFYNMSFYLPLITLPPPDGGDGQEGENYSRIYRVRVIDDVNAPVDNAYVIVKKLIDLTGVYETVGSGYTNGYGEWDIWLIPSTSYKVFLSKDGFQSVVGADWTTDPIFYGADYPKIFQMQYIENEPQPPVYTAEDIHFTGEPWYTSGNDTWCLNLSFLDDQGFTLNCTLTVTSFDFTTNTSVVVGTYSFTDTDSWLVHVWDIDRNMTYFCNITYDHLYLGTQHDTFVLEKQIYIPITSEEVNELFDWLGMVPFGITNLFMWFIFMAVCYYADERDAGKMIIVVGVIFLFIGGWVGLHTPIFGDVGAIAGGALPALFIAIGILMEWNKRRR